MGKPMVGVLAKNGCRHHGGVRYNLDSPPQNRNTGYNGSSPRNLWAANRRAQLVCMAASSTPYRNPRNQNRAPMGAIYDATLLENS